MNARSLAVRYFFAFIAMSAPLLVGCTAQTQETLRIGYFDIPPHVIRVEGGTPNTLLRAGIDKNTVKIGTVIVVRGYQSKGKSCKPACRANGRDMTLADGRKLFMGSSGTGAPRDGSDPREPERR